MNVPNDRVAAQAIATHLATELGRAQAAGLDPDAPRHLTRSVILDPS